MALSLNDVKKKKQITQKKSEAKEASLKFRTSESVKVRPWQTPDSVESAPSQIKTEPQKHQAQRVSRPKKAPQRTEWDEFLQKAEILKNIGLASLPPEVEKYVKDSWVEKIQLYPKVRIPVPSVFTRKSK